MRRALSALAALTLLACSSQPAAQDNDAATAPAPAAVPARVELGMSGLRLLGKDGTQGRSLAFGQNEDEAVQAMTRWRGVPEIEPPVECGTGQMSKARWPDGLMLLLQDGRFVGWSVNSADAKVATRAGIGVGSSRAELDKAVSPRVFSSAFGVQFSSAEGLSGLLDGPGPDSRVTALWAGLDCDEADGHEGAR